MMSTDMAEQGQLNMQDKVEPPDSGAAVIRGHNVDIREGGAMMITGENIHIREGGAALVQHSVVSSHLYQPALIDFSHILSWTQSHDRLHI